MFVQGKRNKSIDTFIDLKHLLVAPSLRVSRAI